jgi:predicted amidohydrolase YtcJ
MKPLKLLFAATITLAALSTLAADQTASQFSLHSVFDRYEHDELGPAKPGSGVRQSERPIADAVVLNGRIYTVNPEQPWAEAVAIKDGKILQVGSDAEVGDLVGSQTVIYDVEGGFVMPGIIDPHIHPGLLMAKRAFCALPGTFEEPSEQQILDQLKQCVDRYPADRTWFIAQGYTTPAMSEQTLTKEYLDKLIPDRPAWIEDETGHNAWFNSKALELVGIDKSFKDTPEEFFSRTPDGELAGVAYEGAMNPFLDLVNATFDTELKKIGFMRLLDDASSKGVTAFGDAYTFEEDLQAWQELYQEGKLNAHAVLYFKGNLGTPELTPVEELLRWRKEYDLPGPPAVKLGMGGAIESYTEALIDGYLDETKSARPVIPADAFADYMQQLDDAGFQVMVHAIGDGAVRATLDGYERVIKKRGNNDLRHHIDHCTLVHPDDFQRFVALDISCSIWPPLNAPIAYNTQGVLPPLKPETRKRAYDNRSRQDAGMRQHNHTDAPAAVFWPWWGMEASATRGFPGKPELGKLNEDQALTVEELIKIYTLNSAWAMNLDKVTGSIEVGKSADMILLNHNLLEISPADIHKTEVQATIYKGKVVYNPL